MKTALRAAAIVLLTLLGRAHAPAQEQRVRLAAGAVGISFVPPAGVRELPTRERDNPAGPGGPRAFPFGDEGREVALAILVSESEGGERAAAEFLAGLEESQKRQFANLEWLGRGPVTLGGRGRQRLAHRAGPSADVVKDMYVTEAGGTSCSASRSAPRPTGRAGQSWRRAWRPSS